MPAVFLLVAPAWSPGSDARARRRNLARWTEGLTPGEYDVWVEDAGQKLESNRLRRFKEQRVMGQGVEGSRGLAREAGLACGTRTPTAGTAVQRT